jgi:hypothetical protein
MPRVCSHILSLPINRYHFPACNCSPVDATSLFTQALRGPVVTTPPIVEAAEHTRTGTLALLNAIVAVSIASAAVVKACFLGTLSAIEASRLADRLIKFALMKLFFIGAVLSPIKSANLVALFAWTVVQALFKGFVGLSNDRADTLLSSPAATLWQHVRCIVLMISLSACDLVWIGWAKQVALTPSPPAWGVLLLLDALCVGVEVVHAGMRYMLQSMDRWNSMSSTYWLPVSLWCLVPTSRGAVADGRHAASGAEGVSDAMDDHAEARSHILYVLELCADLAVQSLHFAEAAHLMRIRGGPKLQFIDVALLFDMRCLAAGAWRRGKGHLQYRRLCHRLRHSFPDVKSTPQNPGCSQHCAICLESMKTGKRLPCGHDFHLRCLADWMRAGHGNAFSCPLCRADLTKEFPLTSEHARRADLNSAAGNSRQFREIFSRVVSDGVRTEVNHAAAAFPPDGWSPMQTSEQTTTCASEGPQTSIVGAFARGAAPLWGWHDASLDGGSWGSGFGLMNTTTDTAASTERELYRAGSPPELSQEEVEGDCADGIQSFGEDEDALAAEGHRQAEGETRGHRREASSGDERGVAGGVARRYASGAVVRRPVTRSMTARRRTVWRV